MHSIEANIRICQSENDYIKLSGRSDKSDVNQFDLLSQAIFNKQQLILATSRFVKASFSQSEKAFSGSRKANH